MTHLSEEEMIAKHYGESENPAAVERHLKACPPCAAAFDELRRDLADIDRIEAPPRAANYGEHVWAAIAESLPVYAPLKRTWWSMAWNGPWSGPWSKGLAYAGACAVLAAGAFYGGSIWQRQQDAKQAPMVAHNTPPTAPAMQQANQSGQAKQPIVVVVLDDHLDRSERFLVELKHADFDSPAEASPMRDEARSLLAANRVCLKNAQASDSDLTTALDHLDSLLTEAANSPGGLNAQAIAQLQQKMNSEALLFQVRVLRSRIGHRNAPPHDAGNGETI